MILFATLFHLNTSADEDEILIVQADIELKSKAHGQFGNLVIKGKYPNMRKCLDGIIWLYLFMPVSLFPHEEVKNTIPP